MINIREMKILLESLTQPVFPQWHWAVFAQQGERYAFFPCRAVEGPQEKRVFLTDYTRLCEILAVSGFAVPRETLPRPLLIQKGRLPENPIGTMRGVCTLVPDYVEPRLILTGTDIEKALRQERIIRQRAESYKPR